MVKGTLSFCEILLALLQIGAPLPYGMRTMMPLLCLCRKTTRRCAMQVPTRKLSVTAADHVSALLAELELKPFNAENKRTSAGKASRLAAVQDPRSAASGHQGSHGSRQAVQQGCTR